MPQYMEVKVDTLTRLANLSTIPDLALKDHQKVVELWCRQEGVTGDGLRDAGAKLCI
jgi:hypothetical protein